jgi:hypothetical protein
MGMFGRVVGSDVRGKRCVLPNPREDGYSRAPGIEQRKIVF